MSFRPLDIPEPAPGAKIAVAAIMNYPTKRTPSAVKLIFRPDLIEQAPSWLVQDGRVRVLIGEGEHAGVIRLEPGGPVRLRRMGRGASCWLRLPRGEGVPAQGRPRTECEYEYQDKWVEVTLPAWARGLS